MGKRAWFLSLLLVIGSATTAMSANWEITGVQAAPERLTSPRGNMVFVLELERQGDGDRTVTSTTTYELVPILDHFGVARPAELVGKRFSNERDIASEAFDLLRVTALHGGHYEPPDGDDILDIAADALANMHLPTFRDIDSVTVQKRFDEVFAHDSAAAAWGQELAARVASRSQGRVQIVPVDPRSLESSIAGKGRHFVAIRGKERMAFGVTTGRTPFVELLFRS